MTAYNFKAEFAPAVSAGEKRQTIRALRKGGRHALPGEALQLFTGMRTRECRKLLDPDPTCIAVDPIDMIVVDDDVQVLVKDEPLSPLELDRLARADGFDDVRKFLLFFKERGLPFTGVLIKWRLEEGH